MNHKISLAIAIAFSLSTPSMATQFMCKSFGEKWYKIDQKDLGLNAPIIEVEYHNNKLFRYGKMVNRTSLIKNLKTYTVLDPSPRLFLSLNYKDCEKARLIVKQIENSGICTESACLYQFRK